MTIAYLASEYPAGSHTFIRREISALRAAGVAIAPFTIRAAPASDGPLDAAARAETQEVLGQGAPAYLIAVLAAAVARPLRWLSTLRLALSHRVPGARALLWSLFHFVEALLLARLLHRAAARHLHVHFANSGATVGMLAANYLRLPWSMTLHGISETDYPAGLLLADKIARAEFTACASWFMRAQAMRHTDPAYWARLHIVRCGVDLADLPPVAVREEGPIRFVSVGRLSPEKGQRILLHALRGLLDEGIEAHLELIGGGPEQTALEALARKLSLETACRFSGPLPERETLARIARADALVLPSFMEGLPVVLIEAMALGIPVIATAVAGIPELVEQRANGVLVRASDAEGLHRAMSELVRDPLLRRSLGAAGRAAVAGEFALPGAALPLVALFGEPHP